ncbi:MAG UNVERIFIED_CONTAM: hypothetical protein LOD86_18825 [Thermobifida fusca]
MFPDVLSQFHKSLIYSRCDLRVVTHARDLSIDEICDIAVVGVSLAYGQFKEAITPVTMPNDRKSICGKAVLL